MRVYQIFLILFASISVQVHGDEHTHTYVPGEQVVLWMNTVWPYHNRQETYPYYDLPYCHGPHESIEHDHETLGEALQGIELVYSGLEIRFPQNTSTLPVCRLTIDQNVLDRFSHAVNNYYWYQMYIDDLPVFNPVGEKDDSPAGHPPSIYTHVPFDIEYNGNQIVRVSTYGSGLTPLKLGAELVFTYSVQWHRSAIEFSERTDIYLDHDFFKHKIHWFSIFNSAVMVVFLVFVVCLILLRTLRRDYARYNAEDGFDELDRELGDEYGWKQVHGDVFRPPGHIYLLTSLVGTGAHIAATTAIVLLLASFSDFVYSERGGFASLALFVFTGMSFVNGLVGGNLFLQYAPDQRWTRQLLIGSCLLPGSALLVAIVINCVAFYYQTTRFIDMLTLLAMTSIVLFLVLPLNLIGTLIGRNMCSRPELPCRVNPVPRPLPEKKWFMQPSFIILVGGLLPFGSIFIELYFAFSSVWAYKVYFVFGFAALVFILLSIVTCSVATVGVYFLLNAEDYRWQWTSFLTGSSVAIYSYVYSAYYFLFKTKMNGLFQTTFYFSYMAFFCFALGTMCGALSFLAAKRFVQKIYSVVKVD